MNKQFKFSRVYVEITNICNRSCSFCPGTKRPLGRISRDGFLHILSELDGVTEYIYLHIMGEPLTHPELSELIGLANDRGFKCSITTNGTLLPREGEKIIEANAYKVNISVHSFEDGGDNDYLDYLSGCMEFADKASSAGVLTVFRLWNRGYDKGRNIDTLAILRARFANCEWKEGANGYRIRHKLHLEYGERFDWPDLGADDFGERVYCHGLGDHFGILLDGRVVPCCLDREAVMELGNIHESSLMDILSSSRAEKIREGFRNKCASEELCRHCGYARRFKV